MVTLVLPVLVLTMTASSPMTNGLVTPLARVTEVSGAVMVATLACTVASAEKKRISSGAVLLLRMRTGICTTPGAEASRKPLATWKPAWRASCAIMFCPAERITCSAATCCCRR